MRRFGGILLLMLFGVSTKAQNLVPNPSFEDYVQCPMEHSQFNGYVSNWFRASIGTPDYFNTCLGSVAGIGVGVPNNFVAYQIPLSGNAYAGAFFYVPTGDREYIETELITPLKQDSTYCIEFSVSRSGGFFNASTSSIHMYLSAQLILDTTTYYELNFNPQIKNDSSNLIVDSLGWTQITGQYVAQGGEKYIVIGNFYNGDSTVFNDYGLPFPYHYAYYYIDDVSIMKCSQVGTSVQSVAQQVNVQLNPNPVSNELQITINGLVGNAKIEIVNTLGQIVFTQDIISSNTFNQVVNMSQLRNGFYAVNVTSNNTRVSRKLLKQ